MTPFEVARRSVRSRLPASVATIAALFGVTLMACATPPAPPPDPPVDSGELIRAAAAASELEGAHRLVFQWSLNEPGMRVSGRGVARIEDPYRARIDLFASNGERIAAAALVGDDLHIPAGMPNVIPETTLLWASLGVFRPRVGMSAAGATLDGDRRAEVRYRVPGGGELTAELLERRIRYMELRGAGGERQDVRLELVAGESFPRLAVYRHHGEVRELRLVLEEVEPVESYPEDIWTPGVAR